MLICCFRDNANMDSKRHLSTGEIMETTTTTGTAAPPSMAPRTFASGSVKRSDSGVALGLFSKIAAARKEKLSSFPAAPYVSGNDNDQVKDQRRGSTPPISTSQFPEIHDTTGRVFGLNARASGGGAASGGKKGATRGFVQTLRWTKQDEPRGLSSGTNGSTSTLPATTVPMGLPNARMQAGRVGLPGDRSRRSLDNGRPGTSERILPLEDLVSRPATAGDEPAFASVRGYVRRTLEGAANNIELPSQRQRRASDTSHYQNKPSTADSSSTRVSALALRGQPEVLVLDHAAVNKAPPDPIISDVPEQEIYFAEASDVPGVPVVYRHQKAKAANPERLNLDRRNLPILPLLDGEQMLRLLNMQNNVIRRIDNLMNLPNLIFLDLYNNRIERLEHLEEVPNLRVLMLGKNNVKRIENLECLKRLDVLDLHSNDIERMENLNGLTELRVLNLGGNRISVLEGIDKLTLLTELNLRRNLVTTISPTIGRLPSLQRLFLSNNRIEKLDTLEPLMQVSSIVELRLDSNAVCEINHNEYRLRMIKNFPLLKHLDLKPLSETERKEGLLHFSQAHAASKEREEQEETQRKQVIAHIRSLWDKRERKNTTDKRRDSSCVAIWGGARCVGALSGAETEEGTEVTPTAREDSMVYKNKAGYSEIEVHGDYRVLSIFGDALDALDSAKAHTCVHSIKFRYIPMTKIAAAATATTSSNLKLFGRLRRLNFAYNDIESFDQLSWLATMGSKTEELFITRNTVCTRTLFRNFVASRILNVSRLNGEEVTSSERNTGRLLFAKRNKQQDATGSTVSDSLLISKTKDASTQKLAPTGSTTTYILNDIVATATDMEKKTAVLEVSWRALLETIVVETLDEISQREGNYMSSCLDGL